MTDTAIIESANAGHDLPLNREPAVSRLKGAGVLRPVRDGWRRLYGGLSDLGVSIEWQEFEMSRPFDWSRRFHADCLEICLNLAGRGSIRCEKNAVDFEPLTAGFYWPGQQALQAWRDSNQRHQFMTF